MFEYFIYTVSFFITFPMIATLLIYLLAVKLYKTKVKAVHIAANWTTILYIAAVSIVLNMLFDRNFIGWIIVFMIVALSIGVIFQWNRHVEVEFGKVVKIVWRLSFLLFMFLYILFFIVGVIIGIFI